MILSSKLHCELDLFSPSLEKGSMECGRYDLEISWEMDAITFVVDIAFVVAGKACLRLSCRRAKMKGKPPAERPTGLIEVASEASLHSITLDYLV